MTEKYIRRIRLILREVVNQQAAPAVCTVALLVAIALIRITLARPSADASAYHQRVAAVAETLPYDFGNWLGVDAAVPQSAGKMLRPTVLISRRTQAMGTAN